MVETRRSSVKIRHSRPLKGDNLNLQASANNKPSFVCVNCRSQAESLYTTYSKEVIRITECKYCGEAVDKYVEYDIVLVFIDLILQYSTAYRHLLLNTSFKSYYRLASIFLLCDAYEKWVGRRAAELTDNTRIYDLEWHFYGSLLQSLAEMLTFSCTIYLLLLVFFRNEKRVKLVSFLEITFMGFYGNIFVVFSIVWKLHQHWSYRALTKLFLLISHSQVQDTMFPHIHWSKNGAMVVCGLLVQKGAGGLVKNVLDLITSFI